MCSSLAALFQRSTGRPCSPPPADCCSCRRSHAARPPPAADSPPSLSGRCCALPCGAADLLSHAPCTAARLRPLHLQLPLFPTSSLSKPPCCSRTAMQAAADASSVHHWAANVPHLLAAADSPLTPQRAKHTLKYARVGILDPSSLSASHRCRVWTADPVLTLSQTLLTYRKSLAQNFYYYVGAGQLIYGRSPGTSNYCLLLMMREVSERGMLACWVFITAFLYKFSWVGNSLNHHFQG